MSAAENPTSDSTPLVLPRNLRLVWAEDAAAPLGAAADEDSGPRTERVGALVLDLRELPPSEKRKGEAAAVSLAFIRSGSAAWGAPDLAAELVLRVSAFPTLDEALLVALFARAARAEPLGPQWEELARYAADARQGLMPDRVAPERAVQSVYLAIAQEALLADPPARATFVDDALALFEHVARRLAEGARLLDDDLFTSAGSARFERYLALLAADRALYDEDLQRGERFLVTLPPEASGSNQKRALSLLVLRSPVARQFKIWARRDTRAKIGSGYALLCVENGPGKVVVSADPASRAKVGFLAAPLTAREREARRRRGERSDAVEWYDGARHGRTLVAAPEGGTRLSLEEIVRVLARELRMRPEGGGRRHAVAYASAAAAVLVAGGVLVATQLGARFHGGASASAKQVGPEAPSSSEVTAAPTADVRLARAEAPHVAGARGDPLPKAKVEALVKSEQKGERRRYALIAGVCGYENDRKLSAPCDDARAVRDLLVTRFGYKREDILFYVDKPAAGEQTDGVPTAENLKLGVESFRKRFPAAVEDSTFLFYYSGHGGYLQGAHADYGVLQPAGFFTTLKTQPLQHRGWDMQQLLGDLKKGIPSKHIMVILDCCYSGWAGAKGDDELDARVRSLWAERAEVVLTAGAQGQQSWEDDPKQKEWGGHGAMTAFLLQGLSEGEGGFANADGNKDAVVTDEELAAFVKVKVPPAVKALKSANQTPQFFRIETGRAERGQFLFVPAKG